MTLKVVIWEIILRVFWGIFCVILAAVQDPFCLADCAATAGPVRRAGAMNRVTLSFDNGPSPGITEGVLEVLARYGLLSRATSAVGCPSSNALRQRSYLA